MIYFGCKTSLSFFLSFWRDIIRCNRKTVTFCLLPVQAKNSYILFASTLNGRSTTLSQTSTETVSESRQWENLWQERQGWAHTGFTGRFDVAFERNMAGLLYPTTFHKVINWTPYKAVPLHKAGPLTPTSPRSSSQLRFWVLIWDSSDDTDIKKIWRQNLHKGSVVAMELVARTAHFKQPVACSKFYRQR